MCRKPYISWACGAEGASLLLINMWRRSLSGARTTHPEHEGATESPLEAALAATESPPPGVSDKIRLVSIVLSRGALTCHRMTWPCRVVTWPSVLYSHCKFVQFWDVFKFLPGFMTCLIQWGHKPSKKSKSVENNIFRGAAALKGLL